MSGITKKQAHIIAAYGYRLICSVGIVFKIIEVRQDCIIADCDIGESEYIKIDFAKIGKIYFIQCLPYEALTKEVEGIGVPIKQMVKHCKLYKEKREIIDYVISDNQIGYHKGDLVFKFDFNNGYFLAWENTNISINQAELFDLLHQWHFHPHGIDKQCLKFKEV